MKRASVWARVFGSTVGKLVQGDLISRGIVLLARSVRQFARSTVQAGVNAESLTLAMRSVAVDAAATARDLELVSETSNRLGLSLVNAEQGFIQLSAATRGTRLKGEATRDIFTAVAETARALNLSDQDQAGVFGAIVQVVSKGTVAAEEMPRKRRTDGGAADRNGLQ